MTDFLPTEPRPHDEAEELLPWYATGQIDEAGRIRVEEHLSSCAECRQQLSVERRLVQEFRSLAPGMEAGWARLRSRMETQLRPRRHNKLKVARIPDFFRRPAIAMLAAAQLAFVVLAGGLLLSLSRPTYHALGSAPAPQSANVIVMFRADATVEEMRDILRASGASIASGPTPAGAYLLRVPASQRQLALAKLNSDDQVQLAEPIDGAAQ
jgi:hypothetical protein